VTDLIKLDALEIAGSFSSNGYLFEFRAGGPDDIPENIGADDDIPGASGMYPGQWTKKSRTVRLYGQVIGTGADVEDQQTSYRSRMDTLVAKMNVNSLVDITAYAPIFGLTGNWTLSDCRPVRMIPERVVADLAWIGVLEFLCIGSPPDWVANGS
jgi:hypothetical protein